MYKNVTDAIIEDKENLTASCVKELFLHKVRTHSIRGHTFRS